VLGGQPPPEATQSHAVGLRDEMGRTLTNGRSGGCALDSFVEKRAVRTASHFGGKAKSEVYGE
jgi:hypothetical protein